jgi:hypothetical protein
MLYLLQRGHGYQPRLSSFCAIGAFPIPKIIPLAKGTIAVADPDGKFLAAG